MQTFRRYTAVLLLGILLAIGSYLLLPLFEADASIASTTLEQNGKHFSAALAYIGIRYWPLFVLALAIGFVALRMFRCTSSLLVALLTLPWVVVMGLVNAVECAQAGEMLSCWLNYRPGYLMVSAFAVVPLGILASLTILTVRGETRRAA